MALAAAAGIAVAVSATVVAGSDRQAPHGPVEDDEVAAPRPGDAADVPGEGDGTELRCAAANDGCLRWLAEVDDPPGGVAGTSFAATMLLDDAVVTTEGDAAVVRDLASGEVRWRAEVPEAAASEVVLLPFEDRLLHLDGAGRLVAREPVTGEVAWASDPLPVEASQVTAVVRDPEGLLLTVRIDGPTGSRPGRGAVLAMDGAAGTWRWHQHGTGVALALPAPPGPPGGDGAPAAGTDTEAEAIPTEPGRPGAGQRATVPEVVAALHRDDRLRALDRDGVTVWEVDDQPPADLALLGPVVQVFEPQPDAPRSRLRDSGVPIGEDARVLGWDDGTDRALLRSDTELVLVEGGAVRWEVEAAPTEVCHVSFDHGVIRLAGCRGEDRVLSGDGDELDPDDAPAPEADDTGPASLTDLEVRSEGTTSTVVVRDADGGPTEVAHLPGPVRLVQPAPAADDDAEARIVLARGPGYLVALRTPDAP